MATQETFESVLLQVRKALCGDINNQDDIVEMATRVIKQRDELLAALGTLTDVLANIAITSGLYDPELHALKAACDVIASVKEMK